MIKQIITNFIKSDLSYHLIVISSVKTTLSIEEMDVKKFYFILLFFFLSGCGGGSSNENSSSTTPIALSSLTQKNAIPFLISTFQTLEPLYILSGASEILQFRPVLFSYEIDQTSSLSNDCISGEQNIIESSNNIKITYRDCDFGGVIYNGEVRYRLSYSSIGIAIDTLTIETAVEKITINGKANLTTEQLTSDLITVTSSHQDTSFKAQDIIFSDGNIDAKIYHNEYGWVQLYYSSTDLKATFVDNDKNIFHAEHGSRYTSEGFDNFKLTFLDNSQTPGVEALSTIPIEEFFLWRFKENIAPDVFIENINLDRLTSTSFPTDDIKDKNYDLLSYAWSHVNGPDNCNFSLSNKNSINATFSSSCQGTHTLKASIFDGSITSSYNFNIEVKPLPAQISAIEDISLTNDESLSFTLPINNLIEDGPFNYQINAAPNGITIDENGVVSGRPQAFISEEINDFEITVQADNGRATETVFHVTTTEAPHKALINSTDICTRGYPEINFLTWNDIDGNNLPDFVCPLFNSYIIYELNNRTLSVKYKELNPPINEQLISIAQTDMDGDSKDEIILGYKFKILVIDGTTKNILKEYELGFSEQVDNFLNNDLYEILPTNSGYNGFFLNINEHIDDGLRVPGSQHLYNLSGITASLHEDLQRPPKSIINIDNDLQPEFIDDRKKNVIYDFNNETRTLSYNIDEIADLDGDGTPEFLSIARNGTSYIVNEINIQTDEVVNSYSVDIPEGSIDNEFTTNIAFANIDADPETEAFATSSEGSYIYNFTNNQFILNSDNPQLELISENGRSRLSALRHSKLANRILFNSPYGAHIVNLDDFNLQPLITNTPYFPLDSLGGRNYNIGLTKPFLQQDSTANLYFRANNSISSFPAQLGQINVNSEGDILSSNIFNNIIANPTFTSSIYEIINPESGNIEMLIKRNIVYQYDLNSETLISTSSFTSSGRRLLSGNINNDNKVDIFSLGNLHDENGDKRLISPSNYFDVLQDQEFWNSSTSTTEPFLVSEIILADIDEDNIDEVITLTNLRENIYDIKLLIFNYLNNSLNLTRTISIPGIQANELSLQDIDNDGKLEFMAYRSRHCPFIQNDITKIVILDDDFSEFSTIEVEGCIDSIPTIKNDQKSNIVLTTKVNIGKSQNYHNTYNTYFKEIEPESGKVVWANKKPFFGKFNEYSLIKFGNSIYSRKGAVFDSGFYTFD